MKQTTTKYSLGSKIDVYGIQCTIKGVVNYRDISEYFVEYKELDGSLKTIWLKDPYNLRKKRNDK